jgi:hypothetical protein
MKVGGTHKEIGCSQLRPAKSKLSCKYIIMPVYLFGKDQSKYIQTGKLPKHIRLMHCTTCSYRGKLHRHSHYLRKWLFLLTVGWLSDFFIQRFECPCCGKVISLFPVFMTRYQRVDASTLREVLRHPRDIWSMVLHEFSRRTVCRWRRKWCLWIKAHRAGLIQYLLSRRPNLGVDVPAAKTQDPVQYMLALWDQAQEEVPNLFHVLTLIRAGGGRSGFHPTQFVTMQ